MNCTVCGKPHSKEQPLTVIEDMLPIGEVIAFCPGCLKEVEIVNIPPYGRSPLEVAEAYVKSRIVSYGTPVKVGKMLELPIEGFEMEDA